MNWFKEQCPPAATPEEMPALVAEEQRLRGIVFCENWEKSDAKTILLYHDLVTNILQQRDEQKLDALDRDMKTVYPHLKGLHHDMIESRGRLIAMLGDWQRAIPLFEQYHDESYDFEIDERLRMSAFIVEGLREMKDFAHIRPHINRFLDYVRQSGFMEDDDDIIPHFCTLLYELKDYNLLLEVALEWERTSKYAPHPLLSYWLGRVLYETGDPLRAMHHLARSLVMDEADWATLYHMGIISWNDLGEREKGLKYLEEGIRHVMEDGENARHFRMPYFRFLVDIYDETGQTEKADYYRELYFEELIEPLQKGQEISIDIEEIAAFEAFLEKKFPGRFRKSGDEEGLYSAN